MSGGRFNYLDRNASIEIFGYCDDDPNNIPNVFEDREISELVWDVFNLIHDYDWYASGDTGEGSWNKSVKDFKEKWFTEAGRLERVERYIDDNAKELKTIFGLNEEYCKDCSSFTEKEKSDYGQCKHKKGCLNHKYERACDKFTNRNRGE